MLPRKADIRDISTRGLPSAAPALACGGHPPGATAGEALTAAGPSEAVVQRIGQGGAAGIRLIAV
jgi:hypothetical protein